MARKEVHMARKSDRAALCHRWSVLVKNAEPKTLEGVIRVKEPLAILVEEAKVSGTTALSFLRQLETQGYIEKCVFGRTGKWWPEIRLKKLDLGEDILGPSESKPSSVPDSDPYSPKPDPGPEPEHKTEPEAEPEGELEPVTVVRPTSPPSGGVILLVDYYNVYCSMIRLNREFPLRAFIDTARKKGALKQSFMFVPPHIPESVQIKIKRVEEEGFAGRGSEDDYEYTIVSCPSLKDGGGDTVDETISEFVRLFLDHPLIATFVIVSDDRDFKSISAKIRNEGKRLVKVRAENATRTMVSSEGDVIELKPHGNGAVERPAIATDIFKQILAGLEQGKKVVSENDPMWRTLKIIVGGLKERNWASEHHKKGFVALYSLAWEDLRRDQTVARNVTKSDFSFALTALRDHGVIKSRFQQGAPKTYYVFNPESPLIKFFA